MVLMTIAMSASARADRIELRDGAAAVEGRVRTVNDDGVTVELDQSQVRTIPWDRIRAISPVQQGDEFTRLNDMAVKLWRARTRVERGDHQLAEPFFEEFFERFLGRQSETALVVMEGMLRCRLARGANDLAVIPALEVARLRLAGVTTDSYKSLPPVFDTATALCPYLPPDWVPSALLPKLARQLASYDAKGNAIVRGLADAYRIAAQQQSGIADAAGPATVVSEYPGVRFLQMVVHADARSEPELIKLAASMGPWAEAWATFAVGRAQLASDKQPQHQAGLLNLLRVSAQRGGSQPYLSGLALAAVGQALAKSGQVEDADVVRAELQRAHPHHPIVATLGSGASVPVTKGGS
jgi:hypothetical protein